MYDEWLLFELTIIYFPFVETSGSYLEEISLKIDGAEMKDKLGDILDSALHEKKVAREGTAEIEDA